MGEARRRREAGYVPGPTVKLRKRAMPPWLLAVLVVAALLCIWLSPARAGAAGIELRAPEFRSWS